MKTSILRLLTLSILISADGITFAETTNNSTISFGAVADIQYADKDTGKLVSRSYRASLDRAKDFVAAMNKLKPMFVISLGDQTDGQPGKEKSKADVAKVAEVLKGLTSPLKIVLGNHDKSAGQEFLTDFLGIRDFHYTFTIPENTGWRFIVLNGNDGKGQYVMSNEQIEWFRAELKKAEDNMERVICFCHQPILKEASPRKHILSNPEPVLKALDEAGKGIVQAWICGHDHSGGYNFRNGVHHLTIPGMVETTGSTSYAVIYLRSDRMVIEGTGRAPSCELFYGKEPAESPFAGKGRKETPKKAEPARLPEAA